MKRFCCVWCPSPSGDRDLSEDDGSACPILLDDHFLGPAGNRQWLADQSASLVD